MENNFHSQSHMVAGRAPTIIPKFHAARGRWKGQKGHVLAETTTLEDPSLKFHTLIHKPPEHSHTDVIFCLVYEYM